MLGVTGEIVRSAEEQGVLKTLVELGGLVLSEHVQRLRESVPVQIAKAMVPERQVENAQIAVTAAAAITKGAVNLAVNGISTAAQKISGTVK